MEGHRASAPHLWRDLVRAKLADIERQRAELDRKSARLAGVLSCAHADLPECPHFQERVRDYLAAQR